jgi:hypothetical protein
MRRLLALLALLFAAAAGAGELPSTVLGDTDVTVDYREGTYWAQLSLRAGVSPALAIEVLTDFEHMVRFVPNLSSSRIVSRNGNVYQIAQQGVARLGPFAFSFESERLVEVMADGRLLSRGISGSSKFMRSELRVVPIAQGDTCRLDYHIELAPDSWLPSSLGVNFMRHELAEQFNALVREMEKRQRQRSLR